MNVEKPLIKVKRKYIENPTKSNERLKTKNLYQTRGNLYAQSKIRGAEPRKNTAKPLFLQTATLGNSQMFCEQPHFAKLAFFWLIWTKSYMNILKIFTFSEIH